MEIDLLSVEEGDMLTFDNGRVAMVRGIIEQDEQRVLQLTDGTDLRVPRADVASEPKSPTAGTKPPEPALEAL